MSPAVRVRPATSADMAAVAAIFGWYVTETVVTFELDSPSAQQWSDRLAHLTAAGWPFLLATVGEEVVGFAYVTPWKAKPGYRFTVEDSVYVGPEHTGRGYGRTLLDALLSEAARAGAREAVAVVVDTGNPASLALHRGLGFREAGRLSSVGHKHDRWLDVVLLQASLLARAEEWALDTRRTP